MVLEIICGYPSHMAVTDLASRLRTSGVRPTPQRVAVLAELAAEPNDATAQELWQRMRAHGGETIGLATVYRTLGLLHEHGVIDALSHHEGERCYRLCTGAHHHHLVCDTCHRVVEIDECDLDPWVTRVAKRHGFVAQAHELEIRGTCRDCR
jgi:Fur family transcriptional regulator, ferric uptake regulator